jgi:hypothetical protein
MIFGLALSQFLSNWNIRIFNGYLGGKRTITVLPERDTQQSSSGNPRETLKILNSSESNPMDTPPYVLAKFADVEESQGDGPFEDLDAD